MSGRHAGNENFPVASLLLPAKVRPHVMAFYTFARTADDIADAKGVDSADKLTALALMSAQLASGAAEPSRPVAVLNQSLKNTGVTPGHAQDLLMAFKRDAVKPITDDWADLMAYCALSAAPVGRYLIDLTGGLSRGDTAPSDALCAALQILNHIQDVKDDYQGLGRIYVPADWMATAGVSERDLGGDAATPALRQILNRMLDGVDELLVQAQPLPRTIQSKALACEAGGILAIARQLSKSLRVNDPLAGRVQLSKPYAALCFLWGALTAVIGYP